MSKPIMKSIKVPTVYGEVLDGLLIPISLKTNMDIDRATDELKLGLHASRKSRVEVEYDKISLQSIEDIELNDAYVEAKITQDLVKLNEDVTPERVKKLKTTRSEKLLEGKTREDMLKELSSMSVDIQERSQSLFSVLAITLWNTLRKPEAPREYLFTSLDELLDSVSKDDVVEIFTSNIEKDKTTDEEIKNS